MTAPLLSQDDALKISLSAAYEGEDWFNAQDAASMVASAQVRVFNQEANWVNIEFATSNVTHQRSLGAWHQEVVRS